MSEIVVSNIYKSFGANEVLKGVTFEVNKGNVYGIVGKNGCGKSTLFQIMTGIMKEDTGDVFMRAGTRLGYLEQLPKMGASVKVKDVLQQAFSYLKDLEEQIATVETQLSTAEGQSQEELLNRYASLQLRYETAGGHTTTERMKKVTQGLQIDEAMQESFFQTLSGGEKTRVLLGKLLLSETDILLLDEPTNHLDIASIEWLERFIRSYQGTVLMISHDRYFLDSVAEYMVEIKNGKATTYKGNYSAYLLARNQNMEKQKELYERQQKEIKRLADRARQLHDWANNEKTHRKAFAIEKRIEHMDKIERPDAEKNMKISVQSQQFRGKELLMVKNLTFAYTPEKQIFQDATLEIFHDKNIAVLGPNGCGKTTFLRLILQELTPESGKIYFGPSVTYAYLPQNVVFDQPNRTILEQTQRELGLTIGEARNLLARYQFTGEDVLKEISVLSGGEKSRLRLCLLLQNKINLLILDEPTNHLDIASREALEDMLEDFEGVLLFVSHDRYFIRKFAEQIVDMEQGKLILYPEDYDTYKERKDLEAEQAKKAEKELVAQAAQKPSAEEIAMQEEARRKEKRAKDPWRIQKVAEIEGQIAEKEEEIARVEQDMFQDGLSYEQIMELTAKKEALQQELEDLMVVWERYL